MDSKRPTYVYGTEAESQNFEAIPSGEIMNDGRQIIEKGGEAALRISRIVAPKDEDNFVPTETANENEVEWTEEEKRARSEFYKNEKIRAGRSQAELYSRDIAAINQAFIGLVKKKYGGDPSKVGREEFLRWEDDFAYSWRLVTSGMRDAMILYNMEESAKAQESMFFTTDEETLQYTVEAQAGRFFYERAEALTDAIKQDQSIDENERKKRSGLLGKFYQSVNRHLELKYMTPEEKKGEFEGNQYDTTRTMVHNRTISQLNALNDLARSYKLRPFTPRNFWTSENQDQTPAMKRKMRYDRDVVEEFYGIAFSSIEEAQARKLEKSIERMRYGEMSYAGERYQSVPQNPVPQRDELPGPYGYNDFLSRGESEDQ